MVGGLEFAAIVELIPFGTIDIITSVLMTFPFYIEGTMFLFLAKNIPDRLTNFLELYTEKLSSLMLPGKLQTEQFHRYDMTHEIEWCCKENVTTNSVHNILVASSIV